MKHYIFIMLSAVALSLASCTDFLDVSMEQKPTESSFFASDKDATIAINYCYFGMVDLGNRAMYYEQAGCGDDFTLGRTRAADIIRTVCFEFTGRESATNEVTNGVFGYIAKTNWVIYSLLKKGTPTEVERRCLGEGYFLRAVLHFSIAYRHGRPDNGVPFDRYEDYETYTYTIPEQRATVMDNYALIIEDLEKAAAIVPFFEEYGEADYGRAHKAACWAYMVKTYAYWAQYDESKWALIPPLVDRIENEGRRGLEESFEDVFKMTHEWGKEYIWSINCSGAGDVGSIISGVVLEDNAWGITGGWGFFKPTLGLFEEYSENDKRRKVTIYEYNDEFMFAGEMRRFYSQVDIEAGFQLAKFMDPWHEGEIVNGKGVFPHVYPEALENDLNIPLTRFADMLLYKAEALIMTGRGTEAATVLNRITARADGKVYTNATLDDLKHERRCELAGEPTDRFMDLKRWKDYDKMNAPKRIRKYADRGDPLSEWTEGIDIVDSPSGRTFNPATDIAFPYNPDDVTRADGKLKQNPMD
jgi:hypothetical protein